MVNAETVKILAVIPARFASTRFPGKPLVQINGKSMVQRVYEQVLKCPAVQTAVVATDDARIFDHVAAFGGKVVMTDPGHPSGTDRCAEVAQLYPDASFVLNVQGDEPYIQPEQIELLVSTLVRDPGTAIATLGKSITDPSALANPNIVKVVVNQLGQAIYFSRHPIPFVRNAPFDQWLEHRTFYKHIGLYGFARETLLKVAKLPPSPLEMAESLEQLRWIDNGYRISMGITQLETIGIDTPEDLEKVLNN